MATPELAEHACLIRTTRSRSDQAKPEFCAKCRVTGALEQAGHQCQRRLHPTLCEPEPNQRLIAALSLAARARDLLRPRHRPRKSPITLTAIMTLARHGRVPAMSRIRTTIQGRSPLA